MAADDFLFTDKNFSLKKLSDEEIIKNFNEELPYSPKEIKLSFSDFVTNKLNYKERQQIYCEAFQKGECKKIDCDKIHLLLTKAVVCKHWLRGLCKKSSKTKACEYLHEYNLAKMPECWFFSKFGECSNNECLFVHIDPNSKSKECLYYNRGFCRHGSDCRGVHKRRRMCTAYMMGFCKDGPICKNGHPKGEWEKEGKIKRRTEDVINLKNKNRVKN